ncbi:hypothetical protein C8Q80DRAFT_443029 [Daedaleopsis nitida]|nr:hypothetical protein C8Q80DRAFT_443029 [Daedaleopsis nitida]
MTTHPASCLSSLFSTPRESVILEPLKRSSSTFSCSQNLCLCYSPASQSSIQVTGMNAPTLTASLMKRSQNDLHHSWESIYSSLYNLFTPSIYVDCATASSFYPCAASELNAHIPQSLMLTIDAERVSSYMTQHHISTPALTVPHSPSPSTSSMMSSSSSIPFVSPSTAETTGDFGTTPPPATSTANAPPIAATGTAADQSTESESSLSGLPFDHSCSSSRLNESKPFRAVTSLYLESRCFCRQSVLRVYS